MSDDEDISEFSRHGRGRKRGVEEAEEEIPNDDWDRWPESTKHHRGLSSFKQRKYRDVPPERYKGPRPSHRLPVNVEDPWPSTGVYGPANRTYKMWLGAEKTRTGLSWPRFLYILTPRPRQSSLPGTGFDWTSYIRSKAYRKYKPLFPACVIVRNRGGYIVSATYWMVRFREFEKQGSLWLPLFDFVQLKRRIVFSRPPAKYFMNYSIAHKAAYKHTRAPPQKL